MLFAELTSPDIGRLAPDRKADLPDDHVESRSIAYRQPMWKLGDVFEIFIARRRSPLCPELHITPNNHRRHLRWTVKDFGLVRDKKKTVDDYEWRTVVLSPAR